MHLPHQFLAALGKTLPGGLARVDDDQQLPGPRRFRPGMIGPVELERKIAARQRRRQQLDHHRQRRALVPAKRQQRAAFKNRLGVLGRLAEAVHAHACRQSFALARGDLHIAMGDGAGGQVEDNRCGTGARRGKGDRVSAEQRAVGAVRHHAGHAVDHTQRDQTFIGERFDIRPQCGEVMGVANRQHRDPGAARLLHQQ